MCILWLPRPGCDFKYFFKVAVAVARPAEQALSGDAQYNGRPHAVIRKTCAVLLQALCTYMQTLCMPYASPAWSENCNKTTIETQKFVKLWGRPEPVGDARLL